MKRSVVAWQIAGYAVTVLLGSLLHFVYGWSGGSCWAALFGSVNESTFEHMKLFFFPAFAFAVFESRYFKDDEAFWCVKLRGILYGLGLIPILFYTLNGAFGRTPDWVNIAIFFLAAAGAFWWETRRLRCGDIFCRSGRTALCLLWGIAILFWVGTFFPLRIPLFRDPVTGGYGL